MDIRQLEILLTMLDSPTLTRAAEKLRLSPAAVSLQLRSIASELKTDLFVRSGKKLLPTPAGLRLAEHARMIVGDMRKVKEEFENDPAKDRRPFHFATGATTLIYRLGRPLRLLRKQYPQLELHVTVSATEEIIAGLFRQQFDLGLISLPVPQKNLKIIFLFEEEFLVLRPVSNRTRERKASSIKPQELANVPFLLYPEQSNMRAIIDRFFHELGLRPRVLMEASDTEAIKRMVESGFGYSILPEYALKQHSRFFQTLRISGHRLVRRQALAMVESGYPRVLTDSVAEFLRQALAGPASRTADSN
jgi:DNA-binding transcriptional LysR family regulator